MTLQTNQLVPVEPTEEMIEAGKKYFKENWDDIFSSRDHYKAMLAAAPQQQGVPVYQVWVRDSNTWMPTGKWKDVSKIEYGSSLDSKRILFTQPISDDASFNQGIDATIEALKGKIPEPYLRKLEVLKRPTDTVTIPQDEYKHLIEAANALVQQWDNSNGEEPPYLAEDIDILHSIILRYRAEKANKASTDMVTMTRDELEEIVFGCVLKGYNYRAETPMSRRIEHWEADLRAIVSHTLNGKKS